MDIQTLRRMIRQSLKMQLAEAKKSLVKPPKDFSEFRRQFANALKVAGAPEDLVFEAEDADYEGGPVFGAMWDAWTNLEIELRSLKGLPQKEAAEEWSLMCSDYVHDAVLDMAAGYKDPMNYEPGRKAGSFNPKKLAQDTASAMSSGKTAPLPTKKDPKSAKTLDVNQVIDAIAKRFSDDGASVSIKKFDENESDVIVSNPDVSSKDAVSNLGLFLTSFGVNGAYFNEFGSDNFVYEDKTSRTEVIAPGSLSSTRGFRNMRITVVQYSKPKR